uniref:Uncharacterized protein n=1 Tax=Alexandrium andersonii TaxID=327968 RepID=A0A7S2J6C1_9DINO|mmetsp:Transcript_95113/g.212996  ORF Transcript_95113/g.212996 Transcript_95113/m.212996 type:complete len:308 (+) Transcript_95113:101-1024(+)
MKSFALELVCAIAFLCTAARVGAVRLASPSSATRHIQFWHLDQAGITDRLSVLRWLVGLADYHHAIAHIPGGLFSTRTVLSFRHSPVIASNWSVYVDTNANGGNPFYPADSKLPCKDVRRHDTDFRTIFDDGATCVNIWTHFYLMTRRDEIEKAPMLPPSHYVLIFAADALRSHGISGTYGIIHIRRCDRMDTNTNCTEPVLIADRVSAYADINSWIVFWYAEPGYPERLKRALEGTAKSFIWEEDLLDTSDNYLAMLAHHELAKRASASIDTHVCNTGKEHLDSWEVDQQREDDMMEKRNGRAYCG